LLLVLLGLIVLAAGIGLIGFFWGLSIHWGFRLLICGVIAIIVYNVGLKLLEKLMEG
jgi:hypothetical protein